MKLNKIAAAALSAVFACTALTSTASAYIAVPSDKATLLDANSGKWSVAISSSYAIDYAQVYQIQAIVRITDEEAYLADKESGFYSDGVTAFADFQGQIAFGGSEWLSFGFTGLDDTAGDSANAAVSANGDGTYAVTGVFGTSGISNTAARTTVTFDEWGNVSSDYALEVLSLSLISAEGKYILFYNEKGTATIEPPAVETTTTVAETEAPETTTTTEATTEATTTTTAETTTTTTTEETTTTTEETTTTAEETAETAVEEESEETETTTTTTAATTTTTTTTTTEAEVTTSEETAAATTTAANVQQAAASSSADFSSRNSQLIIIAIVAIVVIVAAIVGFVIIALKKKK